MGHSVTHWVYFYFWHYRVTLETFDLCDISSEWWRNMTWPIFWQFLNCGQFWMILDNAGQFWTILDNFWWFFTILTPETIETIFDNFDNWKDSPVDLWHLRHRLQFWQLKTWIHDNHFYLTIKSDTGQHSQFLRCFSLEKMTIDCRSY